MPSGLCDARREAARWDAFLSVLCLGPIRKYELILPDGQPAVVRQQVGTERSGAPRIVSA